MADKRTVLVAGDWGRHVFNFDRYRAKSDAGAKLIAMALRALLPGTSPPGHSVAVLEHVSREPTLPQSELKLERMPKLIDGRTDHSASRLRIVGSEVVCENKRAAEPRYDSKVPAHDITVIHDAGGLWREKTSKAQMNAILDGGNGGPIFVHICRTLPDINRDGPLRFESDVWNCLDAEHVRHRVRVICSITPIRAAGCAVSRRLSWEQTVEDLASELFLSDRLRALSRFNRLTVRLGHVGAVHLDLGGRLRSGHLIFAPQARNGIHRDPEEDGRIIGKNLIVVTELVKDALQSTLSHPTKRSVPDARTRHEHEAISRAMRHAMDFFDRGYIDTFNRDLDDNMICESIWRRPTVQIDETIPSDPVKEFANVIIPCAVLRRPPGITGLRPTWEILRDQISRETQVVDSLADTPNRINIGIAIVLFGPEIVLNRKLQPGNDDHILEILKRPPCQVNAEEPRDFVTLPPHRKPSMPDADAPRAAVRPASTDEVRIVAPIARVGNLVTVEREDIESIRSIQNLIKTHLHEYISLRNRHKVADLKPLSIAIFGPPGSGKSFAVRQIIASINAAHGNATQGEKSGKSPTIELFMANLSEFHGVDELERLFNRVQGCLAKNTSLPLVFFDEFDTEHFATPLGWLKHFLAPMQDGKFCKGGDEINLFGAVFVFAGGTYPRFQDFDPAEPPGIDRVPADSKELEHRMRIFRERKGPDFVSRLRGHMNIHAIDTPVGHTKPIIRRALALHGMLKAAGHRTNRVRRKVDMARVNISRYAQAHYQFAIDEDIVYALLTIDRYRHGARSLEAIISMCARIDGEIQKVSLPSRQQMNMHLDADEFFIRMHRSRVRPPTDQSNFGQPPPEGSDRPCTDDKEGMLSDIGAQEQSIIRGMEKADQELTETPDPERTPGRRKPKRKR